jgi:hypothetical protein
LRIGDITPKCSYEEGEGGILMESYFPNAIRKVRIR